MAPADEATMGERRAGDRPIAPRPAVDDAAQGAGSGSRPGGKRASGLAVPVRPPVRCWLLLIALAAAVFSAFIVGCKYSCNRCSRWDA